MLKVVTDSTADLPPTTVRELDIHMVPLSLHFGATTYIDGEDIDVTTFYHLLRTATVHPHTAQPPPGRFEAAFRSLAAAGHETVAITVGAALSGTFNSATVAAATVPAARVLLIDSGTTSMAMGSMVARGAHGDAGMPGRRDRDRRGRHEAAPQRGLPGRYVDLLATRRTHRPRQLPYRHHAAHQTAPHDP